MMRFYPVLLAVSVACSLLAVASAVHGQTVGQVETTIKARPVQMGPMRFNKPLLDGNKKQIISDADFKALQSAAKVDSGKTCSQYEVVPVSSAVNRPTKGIVEKVVDFILWR